MGAVACSAISGTSVRGGLGGGGAGTGAIACWVTSGTRVRGGGPGGGGPSGGPGGSGKSRGPAPAKPFSLQGGAYLISPLCAALAFALYLLFHDGKRSVMSAHMRFA